MAMGSGQRVGLLVLTLCGMAALASLVAPFWLGMSTSVNVLVARGEVSVNMGLYFACTSGSGDVFGISVLNARGCHLIGVDLEDFNTFQVGRLLCLLSALLILLLGPCLCCACCCCGDRAASVLGGTSVFSGLLGVVGGALCMHATRNGVMTVRVLQQLITFLLEKFANTSSENGFQWASYLYMVACSLLLLTGIVLVVLPKHRDPPAPQVLLPMASPMQVSVVSSGQMPMSPPGQMYMAPPGQMPMSPPGQMYMAPPGQMPMAPPGQMSVASPGQMSVASPGQVSVDMAGEKVNSAFQEV